MAAVGADDGEGAVGEGNVGDGGFQFLGGGLLPLGDDGLGGQQDGLAFRVKAASAAGAAADGDGVGVALADADLVAVDAEVVGGKLNVGGLVTLTGGLGADIDIDEAIIGESDFRALGGIATRCFQVIS